MRWTEQEIKFLRRHYRDDNRDHITVESIACWLGKGYGAVISQIAKQKLRKSRPRWTEKQLEFLADNLGRMPDDELARRLKRTQNAIHIICVRRLNVNHKSNIYTARALARELGISCAKIIVAWHDRGYLKGKVAPFKNGPNHVWWFDYDDIIECLKNRPWLCDLNKMPQSYFRSILRAEWEKDPWYTKTEAGQFLGLADGNPVYRYIKKGWLPAQRRPMGGGKGAWIIRHSTLAEFQLHDPRPAHRWGVTLPDTLDNDMKKAEKKAWNQLARGKFQMFGYWASVYHHLASMKRQKQLSPFEDLMKIAMERKLID